MILAFLGTLMQPLFSSDEIARRLAEMGQQLADDYAERRLTVVSVLSGAILFTADLIRVIGLPLKLEFVRASSYRGTATSPGELQVECLGDLSALADRDVLIVDDIFDTGRTLERIIERLHEANPRSLKTAVLLWKTERRQTNLVPDYYGFQIPDRFVVGYGLDFNGDYRHLPGVFALDEPGS
jgi:hypoxanthine phosphoribosyltransferase